MALITLGANAITALPSGVGGKVLQVVTATRNRYEVRHLLLC
jgi:hypothetical protein